MKQSPVKNITSILYGEPRVHEKRRPSIQVVNGLERADSLKPPDKRTHKQETYLEKRPLDHP